MVRAFLIALAAFSFAIASAQEQESAPPPAPSENEARWVQRDGFVWFNDACGASAYQHLLGENLAELHQAALPANSHVVDRNNLMTLEFVPGRLNVVVGSTGHIVAVGCF